MLLNAFMSSFRDWIENLQGKNFYLYSFLFLLSLSILVRLPVLFFDFFSNDEAAHFIGSIIIDKGLKLYSDFVDNKPPLIYLFYLLSNKILGEDIKAIHIMTSVIIIPLIAYFSFLILSPKNRIAGLFAGVFYITFSSLYIPTDMLASNCEILMIFFASIGFLFLMRESIIGHLLFGIFIGLSVLSKQHAAIWMLIPFIDKIKKGREKCIIKPIVSIVGFLIPLLITLLYFYLTDNVENLIYFTIGHNISYTQNPIPLSEIFKRFIKYLVPFILIISPILLLYLRHRNEIDNNIKSIFEPTLILAILMVFVGFRFFPHYFIPMVYPLSILSAYSFTDIKEKVKITKFVSIYILLLALGFNTYTFISYSKKTSFIEETEPLFKDIPKDLKKEGYCNRKQDEKVFIWGYAPLFYYYFYKECSMLPASRFVLPQASIAGYIPGNESQLKGDFNFKHYIISEHRRLLIEDLKKNNPLIIIDTSPANFHNWSKYPLSTFIELDEYIKQNYLLLKELGGFVIYIKR